jgi:IS5 family transposase
MREKRTVQSSLFDHYAEHEIGTELKAMSDWLDANLDLLDWVEADVKQRNVEETGRKGMTIESVLRCAILKQYRQLSYEDLVFCLMDSSSCQTFARLPLGWFPQKPTLQSCISVISAVTWEEINQRLLKSAHKAKVERGDMLRIDSTVTESTIHDPSDSTLLWDSVRVMVRMLEQAQELAGDQVKIEYHDHSRVAKKRTRAIHYTRGKEKKALLYRDLINATQKTLGYMEAAAVSLHTAALSEPMAVEIWRLQWKHYKPLICQVIDQAE